MMKVITEKKLYNEYFKGNVFLVINHYVYNIKYCENTKQAYLFAKRDLGKQYSKEPLFLNAAKLNKLVGYELGAE